MMVNGFHRAMTSMPERAINELESQQTISMQFDSIESIERWFRLMIESIGIIQSPALCIYYPNGCIALEILFISMIRYVPTGLR